MVEFGEQLRKAREEKGMTQQSLAEQLYVTRQSVSRWECGDRYPDLLTTKKISQILEVSLDDLLSGKEMKKVVERNPVIENKMANNIMIALYAFIVFSFMATIVDIVIRFPLQSEAVDYSDILVIVINILSLIIQVVFFAYGLVNAIRGMLSHKRMGIVIVAYFISMCITDSYNISRGATWQMISFVIMLIIPSMLGAVASFLYFVSGKNNKVLPLLVSIASICGIVRIVITNYEMICAIEQSKEAVNERYCDNNYCQLIGSIDVLKQLEDKTFDMIFCHNVLEYVDNREKIVNEFKKMLNGKVKW